MNQVGLPKQALYQTEPHPVIYEIEIMGKIYASALPVAVPDIFVADDAASSSVDRGHSLGSLYPPSHYTRTKTKKQSQNQACGANCLQICIFLSYAVLKKAAAYGKIATPVIFQETKREMKETANEQKSDLSRLV